MKFMIGAGSGFLSAALSMTLCATSAHAQSSWDGISKKDSDAIVTLRLPKSPSEVLLNGERAITFQSSDNDVRVLIPSDSSGISCENVYIVKFAGDKAGQLLANHCHGDTVFNVRPGEISNSLLTKEDVDNPNDDSPQSEEEGADNDRPFARRPVKWNDDQFLTLDSALIWQGGGGSEPYLLLAIPETDAFYWVGGCKNGMAINYIQSVNGSETIDTRVPIYIGTDKKAAARYAAHVVALPFGDGTGPTIALTLPIENELFDRMAADNWLYVISGQGDNLMRTRMSLSGSAKAVRAFQQGCAVLESTDDRQIIDKPSTPSASIPALSSYIGKYILDEVDGVNILNHPNFTKGINALEINDVEKNWLLSDAATSSPIKEKDGKIIIWGCEKHNCANRNWTTSISISTGKTEVCFYHSDKGLVRNKRYSANEEVFLLPEDKCQL